MTTRPSHKKNRDMPLGTRLPGARFFRDLSIARKLALGFGALVLLTLLGAGASYLGSYQATTKISSTDDTRVPAALVASSAQANLLRMLSDVRGDLALGGPDYKERYRQSRQAFDANLAELEELSPNLDPANQRRIQELEHTFEDWSSLPERLFALRDDQLSREPAYRILMTEGIQSASRVLIDIGQLIELQGQREPTGENLALLQDMAKFQGKFAIMFSALRGYVTTRKHTFKWEYEVNLTDNQNAWDRLSGKRDTLTPSQQALLDNIAQNRAALLLLPEQMFDVLESERWREDLYLFETQAVPLAESMQQLLDEMTGDQQTLLQTELASGRQDLVNANRLTLASGIIALALGLTLAFVFYATIAGPVRRLTGVAEAVRGGDLGAQARVESRDEIGTLAATFNNMTDQLRQTLAQVEQKVDERTWELQESLALLQQEIAERVRVEEALRESEEQFRDLYENAPNAYFSIGADGRIRRCNRQAGELLGCDVDELVGRPVLDLYADTPHGRKEAAKVLERLQAGETVHDQELQMQKADGTLVWISLTVNIVRDAQGRVVESRSVVVDITERKQAESHRDAALEALRKSREHLQLAISAARIAVWDWSLEENTTTWSENAEDVLGFQPGSFGSNHETYMEWVYPQDVKPIDERVARTLEEKQVEYRSEYRVIRPDGEMRWISAPGRVFYDSSGAPLRIRGIMMDITERKQIEQTLKESEARFRFVLESSRDILYKFDLQTGTYDYISPAIEELCGISAKDYIEGGVALVASLTHPEDKTKLQKHIDYLLDKKIEDEMVLTLEYRFKHHRLGYRWYSDNRAVIYDENNAAVAIVGSSRDITERVRAEEQIKQALAEKTTLLQELYHRTKNNMQVIHSMLGLQSLYVQDEQFLTVLADVQDKIHAMSLVHQKLYESRDLSRINLKEYIDDQTAHLVQSYQVRPDKVSLDLHTDSVFVLIDTAVPCGLILSELISNAFKHAFPGDEKGCLSIRLRQAKDETITLEVSDNGIGVPSDLLEKSDSLGLQTVVGIVEHQLQGEISIETDHGVAWQIRFRDHFYSPRV